MTPSRGRGVRATRLTSAVAGLGIVAMILVGCGAPAEPEPTPEPTPTTAEPAPSGDGQLRIGTVLPLDEPLGAAHAAAVAAAVRQINASGGVLGELVVAHHRSAGDRQPESVSAVVDELNALGVDAILGLSPDFDGWYEPESAPGGEPALLVTVESDPEGAAVVEGEFLELVLAEDPELTDLLYSREVFDAVIRIALAADQLGDDAATAIARSLRSDVTDARPCASFGECVEAEEAGLASVYTSSSGRVMARDPEGIIAFTP